MNPAMQKLGLCILLCQVAAGCHSSKLTPASAAQIAAVAPQPAPVPPPPPAAPKKLVCTGKLHDESGGTDYIENLPIYVLMNTKLGGWTSCVNKKLEYEDDRETVTFADGAKLTVSQYPTSDAGAEEAVLPPGTSITREDAIKALQGDAPPDFCGVSWSKLRAGGPHATGDFGASGTTCDLDVHVKMLNGSVVGFGFSVAA